MDQTKDRPKWVVDDPDPFELEAPTEVMVELDSQDLACFPTCDTREQRALCDSAPQRKRLGTRRDPEALAVGSMVAIRGDKTFYTPRLSSEILVALYDEKLHLMVLALVSHTDGRLDPPLAKRSPQAFIDRAIPAMLKEIRAQGGSHRELTAVLIGGGHDPGDDPLFNQGQRNQRMLFRVLEHRGVQVRSCDLGGVRTREVIIESYLGRFTIHFEHGPPVVLRS